VPIVAYDVSRGVPAVSPERQGKDAGMDLGLTDRVYLVTGASRGLGLATAQELVADGARALERLRSAGALSDALERERLLAAIAQRLRADLDVETLLEP